jgi:ribosome assembly protein YihI (activator of Der GTPase)
VYLYYASWGLFRLEKQRRRKAGKGRKAEKQRSREAEQWRSRKAKKHKSRKRRKRRKAEKKKSKEAGNQKSKKNAQNEKKSPKVSIIFNLVLFCRILSRNFRFHNMPRCGKGLDY